MLDIKIDEFDLVVKCWAIRDIKKYLLNREENETDEMSLNNLFKTLIKQDLDLDYEDEQFILLKARSAILGSLVTDIEYTCEHCNKPTLGYYDINESLSFKKGKKIKSLLFNNIIYSNKARSKIEDMIVSVDGITDKNYIINYLDNMTINDMNTLIDELKSNSITNFYVFKPKVMCPICNKETVFSSTINTVIRLVINISLESIYRTCVDLKLKANFSIDEVLDMLPFERDVYIKFINGDKND
jgi:transcription elongation factor Elf1